MHRYPGKHISFSFQEKSKAPLSPGDVTPSILDFQR